MGQRLQSPTPKLVEKYLDRMNRDFSEVEAALGLLFQTFPENKKFEHVLWKVCTLNDIYNTRIFATSVVAQHILEQDIDADLNSGATTLIRRTCRVTLKGKVRAFYSFTTKYCSWHKPDMFPIYDRIVDEMLWRYRKQDGFNEFKRKDLGYYRSFKDIVDSFRSVYGLDAYTYKQIDKFLWMYGNSLEV